MTIFIRLLILQIIWYLLIKYGDVPQAYLYPVIALILTGLDKTFFIKKLSWQHFAVFSLFLFLAGLIIDSLLMISNMIVFIGWEAVYSPYFMWAIWLIFLPYYDIAFEKFYGKKWVAFLCGLIFAPISYYSGSKIGNLEIFQLENLLAIGLLWGIFFPISIELYFNLTKEK